MKMVKIELEKQKGKKLSKKRIAKVEIELKKYGKGKIKLKN